MSAPYHGRCILATCSDKAPRYLGPFTPCTYNLYTKIIQPLLLYPCNQVSINIIITQKHTLTIQ